MARLASSPISSIGRTRFTLIPGTRFAASESPIKATRACSALAANSASSELITERIEAAPDFLVYKSFPDRPATKPPHYVPGGKRLEYTREQWPCEGIPELISSDNAELKTAAAEYLPELVDVGIARPYRGDDKGSVEKNGDLLQSQHLIKWGPGYTEGPKQRASDDPADQAYVSIKTAMRELVRYVVETHNHRPLPVSREIPDEFLKTGKPITPINLWNWSIKRSSGALADYDRDTMMPRLLPSEEATITDRGLHVKSTDLYYDLPAEMNGLRLAATCGGAKLKVRVHSDPLFLNKVYLASRDRSASFTVCPLAHISREHAERTKEEMQRRLDYVKTLHKLAEDDFEQRENATEDQQIAAALEETKKLKAHFGSRRARNAVGKQIDSEIVQKVQNDAIATEIAQFFGEQSEPTAPEGEANSTQAPDAAAPALPESTSTSETEITQPSFLD